mmetsp:Transcript_17056/g.34221  ORF Transcript_17056/g.34221 Transcript_17056/m.34221 type:complete len:559 (+) Transcript_17056:111-1787(+)
MPNTTRLLPLPLPLLLASLSALSSLLPVHGELTLRQLGFLPRRTAERDADADADAFGRTPLFSSTVLRDDLLVIGDFSAPDADGVPTGAVFVYRRQDDDDDSWTLEETLVGVDSGDLFGDSLALEPLRGNHDETNVSDGTGATQTHLLVVGAPQTSRRPDSSYYIDHPYGAVHVYVRTVWRDERNTLRVTWEKQQILRGYPKGEAFASWGAAYENFGNSVAVGKGGEDIYVGAPVRTFSNFPDIDATADGTIWHFRKREMEDEESPGDSSGSALKWPMMNITDRNDTSSSYAEETTSGQWQFVERIGYMTKGPDFGTRIALRDNLLVTTASSGYKVHIYENVRGDWRWRLNITPLRRDVHSFQVTEDYILVISSDREAIVSKWTQSEEGDLSVSEDAVIDVRGTTGDGAAIDGNLLVLGNAIFAKVNGSWIKQAIVPLPVVSVYVLGLYKNTLAVLNWNKDVVIFSITGDVTTDDFDQVYSSCQDKNKDCEYFATIGECDKNPAYMLDGAMCLRACGRCDLVKSKPNGSSSAASLFPVMWNVASTFCLLAFAPLLFPI